ncbi:DMT family transporter [Coralliovum pocilloporae]|uniref:DMT family transporter n=1 Tax=Coralliovum pocilloporae TaxID=3066369 RepID=UPI0033071831
MTRQAAAGIILFGAACMSFMGLLIRLLEAADNFQVLVYRSIGICLVVILIASLRRRVSPLQFLRSLDRTDAIMGLFLGLAFSFYIFSIMATTVANTLFLLSAAPFFAAIIGWVWNGEKPDRITWAAMALATLGVLLMVVDGLSTGHLTGNLFALASAFCFALMLGFVRRSKREDVLGGTFFGGLFALILNAILALTLFNGLEASTYDIALCIFMGFFAIGAGMTFVTWGSAYLPSAEVSILVLFESVLGPLWVWLFLGEDASAFVLLGGAIVLAAVCLQALMRRARAGGSAFEAG